MALVRGLPDRGRRSPARRRVQVPLDADARHDLDAMAAAITERTRVVLVCTPNNPTGPAVHQDELDAFLDRVPAGRAGRARRGLPRVRHRPRGAGRARDRTGTRPNVAVLRTFSQGVRAGRPAGRLRRRARAGRRGAAQDGGAVRRQSTRPGRPPSRPSRRSDELLERVDALVAERARVVGGAARAGVGGAETRGQLRLVARSASDTRSSPRLRTRPGWSCGRSPATGVRVHDRRDRGQRPAHRRGRPVPAGRWPLNRPRPGGTAAYGRVTSHSQPYDVSEIDKLAYDADSGAHASPRARGPRVRARAEGLPPRPDALVRRARPRHDGGCRRARSGAAAIGRRGPRVPRHSRPASGADPGRRAGRGPRRHARVARVSPAELPSELPGARLLRVPASPVTVVPVVDSSDRSLDRSGALRAPGPRRSPSAGVSGLPRDCRATVPRQLRRVVPTLPTVRWPQRGSPLRARSRSPRRSGPVMPRSGGRAPRRRRRRPSPRHPRRRRAASTPPRPTARRSCPGRRRCRVRC